MKKRVFILFTALLCIITTIGIKAQITSVSYPSGYLNEEKIAQLIENSRKNGMQEWEVQKQQAILHQQLKKQQDAIANGIYGKRIINPPQVMSGCTNVGFEDGTTNGWTMNVGVATNILPCPTCITPGGSGGLYQVVNSTSTATVNTVGACQCSAIDCTPGPCTAGVDHFGGFSVVAPPPLGGSYSLLMNHSMCGLGMEQALQSFVVSASNTSFTYQFAAVLQDGGHPVSQAPYFQVNVTDVLTGNTVPCTQYTVSAAGATMGALPGWIASSVDPTVYYKPWTTVTLDLSSLLTHTVSIEFTMSDCSGGAHFGYCYIDANCSFYNSQIIASNALCAGGSTILSGPPGMASYNWAGPVTGNAQNLVTSVAGNYTLTTTSATGCVAPVLYYTLTASAGTPPIVNLSASSNTVCSGNPTVLTASGANTYTWSTGAITNPLTVSPTSNTTYTVTGTDAATGCAGSAVKTITVKPLPIINLGNDTIVCGSITQPILLNAGAGSGYTYHWSTGASTQNISVNSGGIYWVHVTSPAGCSSSDTIHISVINVNTVPHVFDTSLCRANQLPILLKAPIIPGSNNQYYWSNGSIGTTSYAYYAGPVYLSIYVNGGSCIITDIYNVVLDTVRPQIHSVAFCNSFTPYTVSAGNYANYQWSTGATTYSLAINNPGTYWVKVTSIGGCTSADTFSVSVINPANVHVLRDTIICLPSYYYGYSANAYVSGAQSYLWYDGYTTPIQYFYNSGVYWVDIHFAGGCVVRDSFHLTLNQAPYVYLGNNQSICGSLSSPIILNGGYFPSYQWSTGATTETISVNSSGIYYETVTAANGCKSTDSIDIQIYPYGNTYHDTTIISCSANPYPIVLQAIGVPPNSYYNYYYWSNGYSGQTDYVYSSGTYYVHIDIGGYNSNCVVIDTFHVSTGTIIKPAIPNVLQCNSSTPDILDAGSGYTGYHWSTGATTQSITVNTSGNYIVTVSNSQGCKISDTVKVAYNTSPQINILKDTSLCGGQSSVTYNATYPGATSYLWNDGYTFPIHTINAAGNYWVIYTFNTTCSTNDSFTVSLKTIKYLDALPNIVTPNNDGKNDFIDFSVYQFPTMQLDIYNRWGNKIFESNNPNSTWQPTCDDGTYFYILAYSADCDPNQQTKTLKGFFTIIR